MKGQQALVDINHFNLTDDQQWTLAFSATYS